MCVKTNLQGFICHLSAQALVHREQLAVRGIKPTGAQHAILVTPNLCNMEKLL